jgi:hypothetical protein
MDGAPRKRGRFDEPPSAARKQRIDLSGLNNTSGGAAAGGGVNPYTARPYSARYYDILKKRTGLPVYEFLDELLKKVKNSQVRPMRHHLDPLGPLLLCLTSGGLPPPVDRSGG